MKNLYIFMMMIFVIAGNALAAPQPLNDAPNAHVFLAQPQQQLPENNELHLRHPANQPIASATSLLSNRVSRISAMVSAQTRIQILQNNQQQLPANPNN